MALQKITKRTVEGSLLIQYKFDENSGDWTHGTSSNSYATIGDKTLVMTPQYPTSVIEFNASFSIGESANSDNTSDTYSVALFINGSNEYEQTSLNGLHPYGNNHGHTGGRNNRTAPTRRLSHTRNSRSSVGLHHAFIPYNTNRQTLEIKAKSSADRDFIVSDLFMMVKEIALSDDPGVRSGSVNFDGVT